MGLVLDPETDLRIVGTKRRAIVNMLKKNFDKKLISEIIEVNIERVEQIKKELQKEKDK